MNQVPTLTTIQHRHRPVHRVRPSVYSAQQVCNVPQAQNNRQELPIKEVSIQLITRDTSRSTTVQVAHIRQRVTLRGRRQSARSAPPAHTVRTARPLPSHAPTMPTVPLAVHCLLTVPWTISMWTRGVSRWVTARHAPPIICALGGQPRLPVLPGLPAHGIHTILWMTLGPWFANLLRKGASVLHLLLTVRLAPMVSIAVSMLRHVLTVLKVLIVLVE